MSAGTYTANVVLASNGVEPEQTIVVNMTVLGAPQITVTQSALDFGNVITSTAPSLEVEITNTGNSTLSISDLAIDNAVFSVSNSPLTIEPGEQTLVPVTFSPSVTQASAGSLTITSDDAANSTVTVNLSGAGISPPTASVDVSELTESLFFGASTSQTFNIQNTGSTDLMWTLAADATATTFVNPNSDAVNFSVENGVIAPASTQAVTITFNPSGSFSGSFDMPLQVVSNDPNNARIDIPVSLSINGIVVNSTIADQLEQADFSSSQFDITGMFTDAQGDPLTITVSSSDETVATVNELSNIVTVTEVGLGLAVISITVDDSKGTSETSTFDFRVNAAPTVAAAIANQAYENAFGSASFDLSMVFNDADDADVLSYAVSSDVSGVVGATIANGTLTLTEQGPGTTNITMTANDGFGGQVSDVFEVAVNKINQTITFNALADVTYGDADFNVTGSASSALTLDYVSSDLSVATVSGSTVTVVGAGTTTITASQVGDAAYNVASDVMQSLTVNQASLSATADDRDKTYGDANPTLTVSYSGFVNGEDASVLDAAPTASTTADETSGAGTYSITASGGVDNNYSFAYLDGTLTVGQASLTATADNQAINKGEALPIFTVSYSGFVNGDDASVVDTAPIASVSITGSSVPGTYDITVSAGSDNNYDFNYQSGSLTVNDVLGLLNKVDIKVYPNPVVNYLTISSDEVSSIEIFDLRGMKVLTQSVNNEGIDLSSLDTGAYLIQLRDENDTLIYSGRIMKD